MEFQMESLGIQDPADDWSRVVSVGELALRRVTSRLLEEATELGQRLSLIHISEPTRPY